MSKKYLQHANSSRVSPCEEEDSSFQVQERICRHSSLDYSMKLASIVVLALRNKEKVKRLSNKVLFY